VAENARVMTCGILSFVVIGIFNATTIEDLMQRTTTRFITQERFPLVIEPKVENLSFDACLDLLREEIGNIRKDLLQYGAVLLRHFPVHNESDFETVVQTLGFGKSVDYIGGDSPRTKIQGGVYTSTEAPPQVKIPLHNELSFVKHFPKHIYFFCQVPPLADGETIIGDARKIYQAIDDRVKRRFIEKGLKYVSCYYYKSKLMDWINSMQRSHKTWLDVFETENKQEVEQKCRENEFDFQWNQNDWIRISQKRPATYIHPETQEPVWFNQVHLYDFNPQLLGWWRYLAAKAFYCRDHMKLHEVFFADGTSIARDDLYHIMDILDAHTVYFPWQKGDLLILDNVLAMHGRATFKGPRRILTAMTG
jgi:alpha-ketoglutarate-dependent taurine dioxygenase